jgi:hypothetical protein
MKIENKNQAIALAKQNPAYDKSDKVAVDENGNVFYGVSDEQIKSVKGKIYMVKGELPELSKPIKNTNESSIS